MPFAQDWEKGGLHDSGELSCSDCDAPVDRVMVSRGGAGPTSGRGERAVKGFRVWGAGFRG